MTNPVCVKGTVGDQVTEINGLPTVLIVGAWWHEDALVPPADVGATLSLIWDAPTTTWTMPIPTGVYAQRAIVQQMPGGVLYDVFLELYVNGVMIDDVSWHGVTLNPTPPLRHIKLEKVWTPGIDFQGLHILS